MPPLGELITAPFKAMLVAFPQSVWSEPALAPGAGIIFIFALLETGLHKPFPVVVSVSVIELVNSSATVGL